MPTAAEIITFSDDAPPPGCSPWVVAPVASHIDMVPWNPEWPARFAALADRIHRALGPRALDIAHVGSTSVEGLAAKPVIDIDLVVADPKREAQ